MIDQNVSKPQNRTRQILLAALAVIALAVVAFLGRRCSVYIPTAPASGSV